MPHRRIWINAVIVLGCLCVWSGELPAQDSKRAQGSAQQRRPQRPSRTPDKLKVGDIAPDFTLKDLDGPKKVTLSDHRGKRPVVLIFGSYT